MPTFAELVARFSYLASTPAVAAVFLTAAVLVIMQDRRVLIMALAVQAVFAGLLFTQVLPPQIAGVKLVVGLLICVIFYVTARQMSQGAGEQGSVGTGELGSRGVGEQEGLEDDTPAPSHPRTPALSLKWRPEPGLPFRIFAVVMVGLIGWQLALQSDFGLPAVSPDVRLATVLLVGLGLLLLGLTEEPFKTGMGLLTVLAGFELFYASVEPALAVMALLAAVDFAVALGSSYLAIVSSLPAAEGAGRLQ